MGCVKDEELMMKRGMENRIRIESDDKNDDSDDDDDTDDNKSIKKKKDNTSQRRAFDTYNLQSN